MSKSGAAATSCPSDPPGGLRGRGGRSSHQTQSSDNGTSAPRRVIHVLTLPSCPGPAARLGRLLDRCVTGRRTAPSGPGAPNSIRSAAPPASAPACHVPSRNANAAYDRRAICRSCGARSAELPVPESVRLPQGMAAQRRGQRRRRRRVHRIRNGRDHERDQETESHLPGEEFLPGSGPGVLDPGAGPQLRGGLPPRPASRRSAPVGRRPAQGDGADVDSCPADAEPGDDGGRVLALGRLPNTFPDLRRHDHVTKRRPRRPGPSTSRPPAGNPCGPEQPAHAGIASTTASRPTWRTTQVAAAPRPAGQ